MPKKITDPVKPGKKRSSVKKEQFKPLSAKEMEESFKVIRAVGSGKEAGIVITLQKYEKGKEKGIRGRVFCNGVDTSERVHALFSAMQVPKEILMIMLSLGALDAD